MIRYLIIDDEHVAHSIIMEYCENLPNLVLQKNCYSALEALQYFNEHEVDLIFLDLKMPKLKGFEFLKTLQSPPKTIVTSAYKEFALEAYNLNVVDYLLKPFSLERFIKAVNKVIITPEKSTPTKEGKKNTSTGTGRLFLQGDKKHIQVAIDDILYIAAEGNYTKVVLPDEIIMTRRKISSLIESLSPNEFLQVHKSFVVAAKHIKSISGNRILIGDYTIPIGKVYKMNVNHLLRS